MFIHESGPTDGPTIVFLHGTATNGTMWKDEMKRLTNYHCLAPDFPGYGQSYHQKWVSVDETANQIIDVISRTRHRQVHIVGLSLGGMIGIMLLSKAPDLIDRAIIDGAGVPSTVPILMKVGLYIVQPFLHTNFVTKTIARFYNVPDEDLDEFSQNMRSVSPSSFTRSVIQVNSLRRPPGLDKVTSPVLFVTGEKEKATTPLQIRLAEIMPNAQVRIAPNMGHAWMIEAPELHYRMVEAWLSNKPLPEELVIPKELIKAGSEAA